jgi:GMP reductase
MFDFDKINLIPQKSIVKSRALCDTHAVLGKHRFGLPVIPANMECIVNQDIAIKLAMHGYMYVYHRFNSDTIEFAKIMKERNLLISISVGVSNDAYDTLTALKDINIIPDYVTIDIAHGHAESMERLLKWIYMTFSDEERPFLIAGNVSTPDAVRDLESWGANAIKVGIGPGSACTTYSATGFGSRCIQASIIKECSMARTSAYIIADGGIKEPGDIVKALVLGADWIMVGGMFSGLTDSPGTIITDMEGRQYKDFWGSASVHQSGKVSRIEGTKKLISLKNRTYLEEMTYICECIQSAISYGGGNSLNGLKLVKYCVRI